MVYIIVALIALSEKFQFLETLPETGSLNNTKIYKYVKAIKKIPGSANAMPGHLSV